MTESFLHLSPGERSQIYRALGPQLARAPVVLEKDVWVCWVLQTLFTMPGRLPMAFKGGTSLSKVFAAIARFSEDVDITLDYRGLDGSFDPFAADVSNNKLRKFSDSLKSFVRAHAHGVVVPHFQARIAAEFGVDNGRRGPCRHRRMFHDQTAIHFLDPVPRVRRGARTGTLQSGMTSQPLARRGRLFVIAAPSGAGKTSLVRALMEREPGLRFSISYTTRPQRPTETHGRDYFFVSKDEFAAMAGRGELLEHAQVFDNYYGTARSQVEASLAAGQDLILEIDWQGAQQIRRALPECRSIFILPPSRAELERRLRGRGTDAEDVIQRRLRDAATDIAHWTEYDFVVVNDDFERALHDLYGIVHGRGDASRRNREGLAERAASLTA